MISPLLDLPVSWAKQQAFRGSGTRGDRVGGRGTDPDNSPCVLGAAAGGLESQRVLVAGQLLG